MKPMPTDVWKREQAYHRRQSQELTFVPGPALAGHQVQWDERHCILYIDRTLVPCTPTEFRLLKLLLEQNGRCVSTPHLIAQFGDAALEDAAFAREARQKLTRQISRIRAKLWPCGLTVVSLMGYGYMLVSDDAALKDSSR